jgi:large subunit ribosomal protein L31e
VQPLERNQCQHGSWAELAASSEHTLEPATGDLIKYVLRRKEVMESNESEKEPEINREETVKSARPEEGEEEIQEILEEEEEKEEEDVGASKEAEKPEEKEKVKASSREAEKEEEFVEERTYTIPLSRAWIMPPSKRAPRAMRILKAFIVKHMKLEAKEKTEEEEEEEPRRLIISNEVNQRIWSRSIEKPPRKLRVRAAKDKDGNVTIYLAKGE